MIYTKEEIVDKQEMFILFDASPFCQPGFELDLCRSCGHYCLVTDYCEKRLFENFEKEGRRPSIENCLEFTDVLSLDENKDYM